MTTRRTLRACVLAAVLVCVPAIARAVTVDDIIALSKSGVGEEVLVALIDADRTIFTLTRDQIVALKQAGVPPGVIVKMIGSAREFVDPVPPPLIVGNTPPASSSAKHSTPAWHASPGSPGTAFVPYPLFVPVVPFVPVFPSVTFTAPRGFGRFMNDGFVEGRGFGRFINDGWVSGRPPGQR
jgi:hypothetical protein